jgi:ribosomal protein L40E
MDAPKVAIACWETQFFLTVISDPPNVTNLNGSGWYDGGTQANFSAAMVLPATSDTRLEFNHWSGEYSGQQPDGSILMDRPKTVEANYLAQYLLTIIYAPASITSSFNDTQAGWYDANSNVQLGPAPPIINLSSVERLQFTGWNASGAFSTNPSYTILVDSPLVILLSYKTQYYVDVRSTYGSVSGAGWYDRGARATITAPTSSSGTWPVSYTLTGWVVDPPTGNLTRTNDSWALTVDGPYVVEAQWSVDYMPLFLLFGGVAVVFTTVGVGTVVAYRKGIFSHSRRARRPEKTALKEGLSGATVICGSCGNSTPKGATFCGRCGASLEPIAAPSLDDKVYEYIVKHEGVISLSTASAELGISVAQLKETTERLKSQGRLA